MLVGLCASKIFKHNDCMTAFLMNKGTESNFGTKLTTNRCTFPQNIKVVNGNILQASVMMEVHQTLVFYIFQYIKLTCNILFRTNNRYLGIGYNFHMSIALSLFSKVDVYILDLLYKIPNLTDLI